ncbi:hypothetical protein F4780DRAFT_778599 [Xylariomycetidae sp. FL0641]|nr:hypothetical protein F4780DRAFT_778599 [Xylariomycetidae sp. FL0641]
MAPRPITRLTALLLCALAASLVLFWSQHASFSMSSLKPSMASTILTDPPPAYSDRTSSSIDLSSPRAPFIAWPLARVCAEQDDWIPGLVFICDNNSGGPGNIRNYILLCIRYAIAAGASTLQLPRIRTRSAADPANLFAEYAPLSYLFDSAHFVSALRAACPQITVVDALDEVPGLAAKAAREGRSYQQMTRRVTPKSLGGARAGCDPRDGHRYTDAGFGRAFRAWLPPVDTKGERDPVLVRLNWGVLWDWPTLRDGPEFVATFGGLLRPRADLLDLADAAVRGLRAAAAAAAKEAGARGKHEGFLGVHLRTEADALAQWPGYAEQSAAYLEAAATGGGFRIAYLASGNLTEAGRFADEAAAAAAAGQLTVLTKHDVLAGADRERLRELAWDQAALVDFAVLLAADHFAGVSPSSFSVNVALRRHLRAEGLRTRPWKVGGGDGRSRLVGRYERFWDDWLFIYDGMWP